MMLLRRFGPVLLTVLLTGCSGSDGRTPVYPVKGSVFYEGRPAAGALVTLHPLTPQPAGTPLPRARVGADGSFVLTTHVNGDGAHPLWKWLKDEKGGLLGIDAIKWNFTKFLVARDGRVLKRYAPTDKPESIARDIEAALA